MKWTKNASKIIIDFFTDLRLFVCIFAIDIFLNAMSRTWIFTVECIAGDPPVVLVCFPLALVQHWDEGSCHFRHSCSVMGKENQHEGNAHTCCCRNSDALRESCYFFVGHKCLIFIDVAAYLSSLQCKFRETLRTCCCNKTLQQARLLLFSLYQSVI